MYIEIRVRGASQVTGGRINKARRAISKREGRIPKNFEQCLIGAVVLIS